MKAVAAFRKVEVIKIRSEGVETFKVWKSHQRAKRPGYFQL